jgi:hypothetical protein
MAYQLVNSGRQQYAVDWDVLERFCRSYWFNYYQHEYANSSTMSETHWYNPFSWKLPDITTIDINWDRVQADAQTAVAKDMLAFAGRSATDMRGIAYEMRDRLELTVKYKNLLRDWLIDVQRSNLTSMHQAVKDYDGLIDAFKFVRDTSADVVVIGSTIATGGAAGAGLLAGGSVLKGAYKYQDEGKVGAAVLYGGGTMLLGAFKIQPKALTAGGEYVLIVAQGALETGTSLASGKRFAESVLNGGLKVLGTGAAKALFGTSLVKTIFAKMPIPFAVLHRDPDGQLVNVANDLVKKTAQKLAEKGIKAGAKAAGTAAYRALGGGGDARTSEPDGERFIDGVPVEQMGLLYFSIVNMDNGVGRGW